MLLLMSEINANRLHNEQILTLNFGVIIYIQNKVLLF